MSKTNIIIAIVVVIVALMFWKQNTDVREELQSMRDSVAANKAEIKSIRKGLDEVAVQDTAFIDSIAASKTRTVVIREKIAKPDVQPFTVSTKSKAFLLDESTK